jgi:NAD(P)-dependent dehydrogenase (short-subunit alcohol dehydrogenase family)
VALVTGAASGIGRATALALAAAGASLALVDRNEAALQDAKREAERLGRPVLPYELDLAVTASLPPLVDRIVAALGRIDILINCAGILRADDRILTTSVGEWDTIYDVNLKAPFVLMQSVARHMIGRGGGGRIVNVGSASAFRAVLTRAAYSSSKAALSQLSRTAAAELGSYDINVNAVAPGLTRTAIAAPVGGAAELDEAVKSGPRANLLGRVSEPEDVAQVIVFLCLPASRQITGQTIHVSAGGVV